MIARDLMTPDPLTVTPQASIAEAWDVMRELAVRHVPVVEDGVLVGMLSDRDLAQVDIARVLRVDGADALREELGKINPDELSPREALELLYRLKRF